MLSMTAGPVSGNYEPRTSAAEVLGELDRILASVSFRRSPRQRALLQYVVTKALNLAQVTERMVAKSQFGRNADFDPLLDPTVRVQYGRLRKRLDLYFQREGIGDRVRIRIPERSYTPVFESVGSEEPEYGKGGESGEAAHGKHDRPDTMDGQSLVGGAHSLAVLPFLNLTDDPARNIFCYGLTDELISALATVPSIDVVARSSAFQFQNSPVDVRLVGQELGVEMILEGSLKVAGDKARVTAQLANVKDGFALWADSYDLAAEPADLLRSQQEIAERIVHALPLRSDN